MKTKPKYWVRLNRTYEKNGETKQVIMLATEIPVIENGFAKFTTIDRETGEEQYHMIVAGTIEEVNQARSGEEIEE